RLDRRLLLSPAERHPASRLGCRLGLRSAHGLQDRYCSLHRHRGAHHRRLADRLLPDGRVLMAETTNSAPKSLRSPISRARGLGSAKEGVGHWWIQRLTALALIPLGL